MKEIKSANELFENEELMKALQDVKNADELVEVLNRFGVSLEEGLTPEKAYELFVTGKERDGDLSDDDLENVSGGFAWGWIVAGVLIGGRLMEELGYRLTKKAFGRC